ncbi:MAG: response regulator [Calditrichaeota bacterium]|nr:MAG: response regulator [Calditrichota bacterium]
MKSFFSKISFTGKIWVFTFTLIILLVAYLLALSYFFLPRWGELSSLDLFLQLGMITLPLFLGILIFARMLSQSLTRPLIRIAGTIRECADAEKSINTRLADESNDEVSLVVQAFNKFVTTMDKRLKELNQYRTYLDAFFRSISIPFLITDAQGNVIRANQSACDFFELEHEDLVKNHLAALLGISHFNALKNHLKTSNTELKDYVFTLLTREGLTKIVELSVSAIEEKGQTNTYIIAFIDITEKIQTQQEILESQARLSQTNRALYQKTKELEMVNEKNKKNARKLARLIEISYETIRCNTLDEIVDILAFSGKDLLDAEESIIFLWDSRKNMLKPVRASREGRLQKLHPVSQNEGVIWRAYYDKQSYFLSENSLQEDDLEELGLAGDEIMGLIAVPISDHDYNHGVAVYLQNEKSTFDLEDLHLITSLAHQAAITLDKLLLVEALKEKARHLEKVNEDLQQSQQQIIQLQKMESLGTLVGGIAHDFNNILGIITPNIDLLKMAIGEDERSTRRLNVIQEAAERAANLTKQLLMFSRNQPVRLEPLSPNETIQKFIPVLQSSLGKQVQVVTELSKDLPNINADETRFTQVLMNLALNARDAMPDGGVITVRTSLEKYRPSATPEVGEKEMVKISVSDTGTGIPDEHLDKIFDPFFTTKSVGQGTGLGLSVVYGIIKSHNGYIEVETSPGKGTVFHIYFEPTSEAVKEKTSNHHFPELKGSDTILLVDDEDLIRESISDSMSILGYQVFQADGGENAIKVVKEHPSIDIAIVDLAMPGMSGVDTIKAIKKINPRIKAVLSSGHAEQKELLQKNPEISAYLQKPYHLDELIKLIKELKNHTLLNVEK